MMRRIHYSVALFLISVFAMPMHAQKKGLESISVHDLKSHMSFLASDELSGRKTGEPGLGIASKYLAVQAQKLGLLPAGPGTGYLQPYTIQELKYDRESSSAVIVVPDSDPVIHRDPFYLVSGVDGIETVIEGEVVFAGYGIQSDENEYNDFRDIDIEGKVVLIMSRAPMNEDGTALLFEDRGNWNSLLSYTSKLQSIYARKPRAVLQVTDPKSGVRSLEERSPRFADYLSRVRTIKREDGEHSRNSEEPKMVLIHRNLADQLLRLSGKSLEELQLEIDRTLTPQSFDLEGVSIRMELRMSSEEMEASNVFGLIEGNDPGLKDEVVIYMAHFDHMGTDGEGGVFNGADDNASGTVALIEIAEAFMKEKRRPRRSIGFLWVSAEEIGLFGSEYFSAHPMVPAESMSAVINLDMVGRSRTAKDDQSSRTGLTIVEGDTVNVIGGLQSKVLMDINRRTLEEMGMVGNYTYNNVTHPDRYFFRSDHINFARKDIPVLYYSTGTHLDYHRLTDEESRIDYDKFLKMTRLSYKAGFNVASYPGPIDVDNPMTSW